jgi:hypothetical protein
MVDKSPAEDKLLQRQVRVWEPKEHRPCLTWTRSGYKPYSTYVGCGRYRQWHTDTKQSQEQVLGLDTRGQGTTVECSHFHSLSIVYIKNELIELSADLSIKPEEHLPHSSCQVVCNSSMPLFVPTWEASTASLAASDMYLLNLSAESGFIRQTDMSVAVSTRWSS